MSEIADKGYTCTGCGTGVPPYTVHFCDVYSIPHTTATGVQKQTAVVQSEKCFRIWAWRDAPAEYRALSTHGGDEDWVLHIPAALIGEDGPVGMWHVTSGDEDSYVHGYGHVDRHELPNGDRVVIFAHA